MLGACCLGPGINEIESLAHAADPPGLPPGRPGCLGPTDSPEADARRPARGPAARCASAQPSSRARYPAPRRPCWGGGGGVPKWCAVGRRTDAFLLAWGRGGVLERARERERERERERPRPPQVLLSLFRRRPRPSAGDRPQPLSDASAGPGQRRGRPPGRGPGGGACRVVVLVRHERIRVVRLGCAGGPSRPREQARCRPARRPPAPPHTRRFTFPGREPRDSGVRVWRASQTSESGGGGPGLLGPRAAPAGRLGPGRAAHRPPPTRTAARATGSRRATMGGGCRSRCESGVRVSSRSGTLCRTVTCGMGEWGGGGTVWCRRRRPCRVGRRACRASRGRGRALGLGRARPMLRAPAQRRRHESAGGLGASPRHRARARAEYERRAAAAAPAARARSRVPGTSPRDGRSSRRRGRGSRRSQPAATAVHGLRPGWTGRARRGGREMWGGGAAYLQSDQREATAELARIPKLWKASRAIR